MDLSWRFDFWWSSLPESPSGPGTLRGLVVRPGRGRRERREEVELSPEQGVVGDYWGGGDHDTRGNQISVINYHVVQSLAGGDAERSALSGDNLQVDLDLSEENLPAGTHLTIGDVVLCVSDVPHRPCRHFIERFGKSGAKKVARANRKGRRGRGLLCEVVQGGTVRVGDKIYVRRAGDWTKND